ncbi:HNH endonuclease signature motif containing protein [Paenibacillus elgii]|uniref:HNH endonuclease n=1 Tax=Paenibacillus elgii TaxID=189691 RepID=UPI002D7BC00B|nr:HNH endonuclease signature motif containing protein [Paenibacillus elgii]
MNYKVCTKCKENKPSTKEYFYTQKTTTKKYGVRYVLTSWCRDCINKKQAKYRKEHIEECRIRELKYYHADLVRKERKKAGYRKHAKENREVYAERLSEWQKANPNRVREYNRFREMHKKHDVTNNEWENCKNYFNYRCAYCGYPTEEHFIKRKEKCIWSDFHKEHFDHDGSNDITNLIPSCLWCNSSKHQSEYDDWYNESNEDYTPERHYKIKKWIFEDHKKYRD